MAHDLSIVIPVRNEAPRIPGLVQMLARQEGVSLVLIVIDGESSDDTVSRVIRHGSEEGIDVRVGHTPPNRARQIEQGVSLSLTPLTMILHADSRFDDHRAIGNALHDLRRVVDQGDHPAGGHFRLRFEERDRLPPRWLAFQEAKGGLSRRDCIHGDQGLIFPTRWLARQFPLPPDRPMLAETILANRMLEEGEMILFDSHIITSARRFLREGVGERQLLNALILNAHHTGWDRFFREHPPLYREDRESERLDRRRVIAHAVRLLEREEEEEKRRILRESGRYLVDNAWQIPLMLDLLLPLHHRSKRFPLLWLHDRFCAPLLGMGWGERVGEWILKRWLARQLAGAAPP